MSRSCSSIPVVERLRVAGVIAIFDHEDAEVAVDVVDALVLGGITAVEFTNRNVGGPAVFARLADRVLASSPGLVLGVGSIVDSATAATFMNAGAEFVVGPGFVPDVADLCGRRGIVHIPGCATVTEMLRAGSAGCALAKVFPAGQLGGPAFLEAVRAPCPWLRLVPTGGVGTDAAALRAWFDAGAFAVGIGSALTPKDLVAEQRWDEITARARGVVEAVRGFGIIGATQDSRSE